MISRRLDAAERGAVCAAFERYLGTIPESKKFRGIGAGLPAYNVLIEGYNQALDNDVVLSMKQGNVAAPSRVVTELSPYVADLDWTELTEPDEIAPVLDHLGRATAKVHCVSDADSDHTLVPFQTEDAIVAVIGDRETDFVDWLTTFAREYAAVVRDDHRLFVDAFRNDGIPGVHSTQQGLRTTSETAPLVPTEFPTHVQGQRREQRRCVLDRTTMVSCDSRSRRTWAAAPAGPRAGPAAAGPPGHPRVPDALRRRRVRRGVGHRAGQGEAVQGSRPIPRPATQVAALRLQRDDRPRLLFPPAGHGSAHAGDRRGPSWRRVGRRGQGT